MCNAQVHPWKQIDQQNMVNKIFSQIKLEISRQKINAFISISDPGQYSKDTDPVMEKTDPNPADRKKGSV